MKSARKRGSPAVPAITRQAKPPQTSLTQFFTVTRPLPRSPLASSTHEVPTVTLQQDNVNNRFLSIPLSTPCQLNILQFVKGFNTPLSTHDREHIPDAPQKDNLKLARHETVSPCHLTFSSSPTNLCTSSPAAPLQLLLLQTKITAFFPSICPRRSPHQPPLLILLATPAPPIAGSRRSRRSMLSHNLLQYNYHNTTNYRPIHSFPMVTPPQSTLYDSWGHSLPRHRSFQSFPGISSKP
jgi:hypothetical protein